MIETMGRMGIGARGRGLLFVLLLGVALGCSSKATTSGSDVSALPLADASSADSASSAPSIAAADFPAAYTQALCDVMGYCCNAEGFPFEAGTCATHESEAPPGQNRTYDPTRAAQCISLIRDIATTCAFSQPQLDEMTRTCDAVYVGTLPTGAQCTDSRDCVGGLEGTATCALDRTLPKGANTFCQPIQFASSGDPCPTYSYPEVRCSAGLWCNGQTVCVPLFQMGEACEPSPGLSVEPSLCAAGLGCINGTCAPKKANGEPCMMDDDCVSGTCDGKQCVAGLTFSANDCAFYYPYN